MEYSMQNFNDTISGVASNGVDQACVFAENDPYGALMALVGMGIVFSILLLMYLVFNNTPKLYTPEFKEKMNAFFSGKGKTPEPVEIKDSKTVNLSGEVNAAIAVAIHLYRSELHDYEDTVLTINKVSRTYSPWSSKIYGLRPVLKK
jgi:glutaconyl-CoA/methylmalonyl-CoA decarboxylase subunit delta